MADTSDPLQFSNVGFPANLLQEIGHVIALWARLEYEIDRTLRFLLDQPAAPAIDTSLILLFKKRLQLLSDLMSADAPHADLAAEIIVTAKRLQPLRDIIAHGSIANSEQLRRGVRVFWFQRVYWGNPVRVSERKALSVAQVNQIAKRISDAVAVAGPLPILLEMELPSP